MKGIALRKYRLAVFIDNDINEAQNAILCQVFYETGSNCIENSTQLRIYFVKNIHICL